VSDDAPAVGCGSRFGRLSLPALKRWNLSEEETAMLAGVLLLTLLVYLRCLANGFVSDDHPMIVENKYIAQWSYLWKSLTKDAWWFFDSNRASPTSHYLPIQNIWLWLAFHFFGTNPVGWHLAKIALHLCVVLLVFRLAQLLSKSTSVALLAALLFGLLPVHVEPIVFAAQIPEPLSTAFDLGAMCVFIRRARDRYWSGILAPLLLYAGAAFSHESAVVFPVLIAAYVFLFETDDGTSSASGTPMGSGPIGSRLSEAVKWSAPFFCIALLYLGARALVLGTRGILGFTAKSFTATLDKGKLVIQSVPIHSSAAEILATLPSVLLWYLGLLLLPWLAGPAHEAYFVNRPTFISFYAPCAILLLLTAGGHFLFRNSPRARLYLFCAIWWLVATAPAPLPAIRLGADLIHDRYQYLPSFAFCLLLADMAVQCGRNSAALRRVITVTVTALVVVYAVDLWRAEAVWYDDITLFSRCVQNFPDLAHYHEVLGALLVQQGDLRSGERELVRASTLEPINYELHFKLASLYVRMKRDQDAHKELEATFRTAFARKAPTPQTIASPQIVVAAPEASVAPTTASQPKQPK
jgi:protein O-mannosyl-transferase